MNKFRGHFLSQESYPQYNLTETAYENYCGGEESIFVDNENNKIYIFEHGRVQEQSLVAICDSWLEVSKYFESQLPEFEEGSNTPSVLGKLESLQSKKSAEDSGKTALAVKKNDIVQE